MRARTTIVAALIALGCSKDRGGQSFREGIATICAAGEIPEARTAHPAERQAEISRWIDARVTNRDAREVFERLSGTLPADRPRLLDDAARRAGLDGCALVSIFDPLEALSLVDVTAPLSPPADGPLVIVTTHAVVFQGETVAPVRDGRIDERDRIERFARAHADASDAPAAYRIAVEPAVPYQVLVDLLGALKAVSPRFALLARHDGQVGAIEVVVPPLRAGATSGAPAPLVGTLVRLTPGEPVTSHPIGGAAPSPETPIYVLAEPTMSAAALVPALAAAKRDVVGSELRLGVSIE